MKKFQVQLPTVIRQALKDARRWFCAIEVEDDLDLMKIKCKTLGPDLEWVGLTFECGLRFYVAYDVVPGEPTLYAPRLVWLWRRKQEGYGGRRSIWTKWKWDERSQLIRVA